MWRARDCTSVEECERMRRACDCTVLMVGSVVEHKGRTDRCIRKLASHCCWMSSQYLRRVCKTWTNESLYRQDSLMQEPSPVKARIPYPLDVGRMPSEEHIGGVVEYFVGCVLACKP